MPKSFIPDPEFTLACEQRDFVEWRLGRTHYAVWAIDVDTPAVRAGMAAVCARLDGHLLAGYRRQPHITLHLCGFPTATPRLFGDWPMDILERQLADLRSMAPEPFALEIGAADTFSSAAYLSVADPERGIDRLRSVLGDNDRDAGHPYVPHVTCGLYGGEFPMAQIREILDEIPVAHAPMRLEVKSLSLMAYEAADVGGPLYTLCKFDLSDRRTAFDPPDALRELFISISG